MALAVGDRVGLSVVVLPLPLPHTVYLFGTVSTAPGGAVNSVLWDNGRVSTNIPDERLDLIIPTDLPGGVARKEPYLSATKLEADTYGLIMAAYFRQGGGDDTPTGPFYLMKLLTKLGFVEAESSQVQIVSGR